MTLRLWALRHAKSAWEEPALPDHDRPLAPRGRRAAAAMGAFLAGRPEPIDLVLCSTARRAVDTTTGLRLPEGVPVRREGELYRAAADDLLERLATLEVEWRTVLLVGHNPALEDLVRLLRGDGPARAARRLARGLKTACLAELELQATSWSGIAPGRATLTTFTRPKDLPSYASR